MVSGRKEYEVLEFELRPCANDACPFNFRTKRAGNLAFPHGILLTSIDGFGLAPRNFRHHINSRHAKVCHVTPARGQGIAPPCGKHALKPNCVGAALCVCLPAFTTLSRYKTRVCTEVWTNGSAPQTPARRR